MHEQYDDNAIGEADEKNVTVTINTMKYRPKPKACNQSQSFVSVPVCSMKGLIQTHTHKYTVNVKYHKK